MAGKKERKGGGRRGGGAIWGGECCMEQNILHFHEGGERGGGVVKKCGIKGFSFREGEGERREGKSCYFSKA